MTPTAPTSTPRPGAGGARPSAAGATAAKGPGRFLPAVAAALLVLGSLLGFLVARTMSSSYVPYKATQVLGVVPSPQGGGSDGAVAAAAQWAAVGASAPFQLKLAQQTGQDADALAKSVKVAMGEMSPTVTVTVTGSSRDTVTKTMQRAVSNLQESSSATDPRYPVKPLTDIGVQQVKKPSTLLPGLAAAIVTVVLGLLVFGELTRRAGRHARED